MSKGSSIFQFYTEEEQARMKRIIRFWDLDENSARHVQLAAFILYMTSGAI